MARVRACALLDLLPIEPGEGVRYPTIILLRVVKDELEAMEIRNELVSAPMPEVRVCRRDGGVSALDVQGMLAKGDASVPMHA